MTAIKNSHLNSLISPATRQNWRRLGVLHAYNLNQNIKNHTQITAQKLTTRANKKLSAKSIVPTEYFCNTKNIPQIQSIVEHINAKKIPHSKRYILTCAKLAKSKKSIA